MTYDPIEIFQAFHTYYSKLYNIPIQQIGMDVDGSCNKVGQYIRETALPVYPEEIMEELERDLDSGDTKGYIHTGLGQEPGPRWMYSSFFL